jgi:cation-transporting ATPase I
VGLPGPARLARLAAGTALHVATTGIGLAAGTASLAGSLVAPPVRQAGATAGAVAESAAYTATVLARAGARAAGALVTGVDDATDGNLERLTEAGKAMFEPPAARRSRRVWVSRGRAHLELAAPAAAGGPSVRRALRRQLERLDGVEWAAVNDAVGRVLVTFDERRVRVDDVVEVIAAIEQARGGTQVFPLNPDHPADLEPLVAALVTLAVDTVGIGVAYAGRVLPVPRLTRHATLALAGIDSQQWIKKALVARIGTTGTDLAFTGASALLHALTQSPAVPALNAAAAAARVWEMRARREVWRRPEPELCRPGVEATSGPLTPPGPRPCPLPHGPIEGYRGKLGPTALGGALGLLPLTFAPSRSADLLKALTPKAAVQGREAFAGVLDVRMCGRGVLPMDGSAYRRLDRVSAVVVDGATLCTGPPVVVEVGLEPAAEAAGWDAVSLWTGTSRLLGSEVEGETPGRLRLGPAGAEPDRPGARVHAVRDADGEQIGTAVVTDELDPHAEALLRAVGEAGHRLVLTAHAGVTDVAGLADEVAPPEETPAGDGPPRAGTGARGAAGRLGGGQPRPAGPRRRGSRRRGRRACAARRGRRGRPDRSRAGARVGRGPRHRAGPRRRVPDRRRDRRRAHPEPPVRGDVSDRQRARRAACLRRQCGARAAPGHPPRQVGGGVQPGLGCLVGTAVRRPPRARRHRAHPVARPGPGSGAPPGRGPLHA